MSTWTTPRSATEGSTSTTATGCTAQSRSPWSKTDPVGAILLASVLSVTFPNLLIFRDLPNTHAVFSSPGNVREEFDAKSGRAVFLTLCACPPHRRFVLFVSSFFLPNPALV
eukprot:RCo013458